MHQRHGSLLSLLPALLLVCLGQLHSAMCPCPSAPLPSQPRASPALSVPASITLHELTAPGLPQNGIFILKEDFPERFCPGTGTLLGQEGGQSLGRPLAVPGAAQGSAAWQTHPRQCHQTLPDPAKVTARVTEESEPAGHGVPALALPVTQCGTACDPAGHCV